MPLQATSGAASYDAFGGGVPVVPNYIEEVFQTWLYTGTGSAQTITNGIDFSTKGGLLWLKARDDTRNNWLYDTTRSIANGLRSDSTAAATSTPDALTAFNSNGFSIGTSGNINTSGNTLVSWSFRKQPKFFDVVTYTGTGSARTVAHNLGSVPGCILVKCTSTTSNWRVYHRSLANTNYLQLNLTTAQLTNSAVWNSTTPTATEFTVGTDSATNDSGATYVAYLFAHDAGGFGLTGTDNVISCGSFTTNASGIATVTLGYEPQWVLIKRTDSPSEWHMLDNMRGFSQTIDAWLRANSSAAENSTYKIATPTATGFVTDGTNIIDPSSSFIYIAIRRGPMEVPTSGTTVFNGIARTGTGANASITTVGFPPDLLLGGIRSPGGLNYTAFEDKLRGPNQSLQSGTTGAEFAPTSISVSSFDQNGYSVGPDSGITNYNDTGVSYITWALRRAPSVFDEVCATCPSSGDFQVNHNLTVVPEFVITKSRSNSNAWNVYHKDLGRSLYLNLNTDVAQTTGTNYWNVPTTTTFGTPVGIFYASGWTAVFYMFATAPGVSKVGSYTGNGSTQTINCGFGAGGARFVLIKRTDSAGDWYVYDSIRGMTVLTDPYLLWNSTAAESATLGSVTTVSTGFAVNASILSAINTNAASYIFLAIA